VTCDSAEVGGPVKLQTMLTTCLWHRPGLRNGRRTGRPRLARSAWAIACRWFVGSVEGGRSTARPHIGSSSTTTRTFTGVVHRNRRIDTVSAGVEAPLGQGVCGEQDGAW